MRRWIWRSFAAVPVVLALLAGAGFLWLRSSLPQVSGTLTIRGLAAPVEILRDANGVPHIFAETDTDAYLALGFVHAQDRLWQMDMLRRMGTGRLAETVGEPALKLDRMVRTLGFYRLAEHTFHSLDGEVQAALNAYADGVNAFLAKHEGAWPPEFYLLDYEPEPWLPRDSLVWGRLMALRLGTNWQSELMRARFLRQLEEDQIEALWPPYPAAAPVTIRTALRDTPLESLWAALPHGELGIGASNAWVVDGRYTASGKPLLANDPHLGLGAPIMWYLARIETPDLSITGATVPGMPFHLLGHNGHIAWGLTTTYADTDDLFIERLDPDDPSRYLTPGGPRPFVRREELIKVRGGATVTLHVRESERGPVLDSVLGEKADAVSRPGHVFTLAAPWLRVDDRTASAVYRLNRARGWDGFAAALTDFHAPTQNVVYADTTGTIGIYTSGRIPVRREGDGYLPTPGWRAEGGWDGFIPFDALPHRRDPADGRLVNANNRVVDDSYPYFLSHEWGDDYRARRIADLLAGDGLQTADSAAAIQRDTVSYAARDLLPRILAAPPAGPREEAVRGLLSAWDGTMDRTRAEPLLFTAWLRALNRRLYADELGVLFDSYWALRPGVVADMLAGDGTWCDDVGTDAAEGCDEVIAAALADAIRELSARYGEDMAAWRWGDAHYADLGHRVLRHVPFLGGLVDLSLPSDGGDFTVNRAATAPRSAHAPYAQRHGAGFRGIYDLSRLSDARFIIATGQSGNPLSRHFGDLVTRWRDGEYLHLGADRESLAAAGARRLVLRPPGPDG